VTERSRHPGDQRQVSGRADPSVTPPPSVADTGIEVREEQWTTVTAQRLYKLRCECGRSWFEIELPKLVQCPGCHELGLVSE